MKEFGAALKQAREEAGLTLENIHDRTRIHIKHLRSIENGDFPSVPPTYVRAFIREFARIVGLDEDATVAEYNRLAEELKGIPPPPEALDHSHLTPKIDDSVEIIEVPTVRAAPSHVEVQGKPEVEKTEFTLPVKRSKYVSDDHLAVDMPDASHPRTPETPAAPPAPKMPVQESVFPEEPSEAPASVERKELSEREEIIKKKPPLTPAASVIAAKAPETPAVPPKETLPKPPVRETPTVTQHPGTAATAPPVQQAPPPKSEPAPSMRDRLRSKGASAMPGKTAEASAPPPVKPLKKRTAEDEEQRRLIVIGSLITLAVIIGIYGIVYFSEDPTPSTAVVDSTKTNPNVYAERFIDSTDFIPDEPEILPDTTTGALQPGADDQARGEIVFSADDSLVLEAFSSTPVYFSIRMDTTKTEKGFLGKNEHRLWKAKDRFVISLGDAGAMTFFLNGRQLRSLGGEGLAINNHVVNRKSLDQE